MNTRIALQCLTAATTVALTSLCQAQQSNQMQEPERLFVSDKLVLSVYAEPGQAGERVGTIETGDAVDALERAGKFVHVRLADGREGWVGAHYLSSAPPAAVRLRELQRDQALNAPAANRASVAEIARLQEQNAALQNELKRRADSAGSVMISSTQDEPAEHKLQAQAAAPATTPNAPPERSSHWIFLLAASGAGGVGFAAGYQTLARRIRRKFGGLKIY
ncbi:MAG TPA: TIGR04211 family SH3 domain-containing protein [Steroidobacter sp.]|jgi:SH3 domain protein|nr:TIGR04211 family SH3 domain-containing protein [Steroidobacter sp.]